MVQSVAIWRMKEKYIGLSCGKAPSADTPLVIIIIIIIINTYLRLKQSIYSASSVRSFSFTLIHVFATPSITVTISWISGVDPGTGGQGGRGRWTGAIAPPPQ